MFFWFYTPGLPHTKSGHKRSMIAGLLHLPTSTPWHKLYGEWLLDKQTSNQPKNELQNLLEKHAKKIDIIQQKSRIECCFMAQHGLMHSIRLDIMFMVGVFAKNGGLRYVVTRSPQKGVHYVESKKERLSLNNIDFSSYKTGRSLGRSVGHAFARDLCNESSSSRCSSFDLLTVAM